MAPHGEDTRPGIALLPWAVVHMAIATALRRNGLAERPAAAVAEQLTISEAMGVESHGLNRLHQYCEGLVAGRINTSPAVTSSWVGEVLAMDADHGPGQFGVQCALEQARQRLAAGSSFVPFVVVNADHAGALGAQLIALAENGLVAFLSQTTRPNMAPPGGVNAAVGNNPIAFAAPRADGKVLLVDMALSVTSVGRIRSLSRRGASIPLGWAIDRDGNDTTDPAAALEGALLPAGGHKGLALAMALEVLAGMLPRALAGLDSRTSTQGNMFGFVVDAAAGGHGTLSAAMTQWCESFAQRAGDATRFPGDAALASIATARRDGLMLRPEIVAELEALSGTPIATF